MNVFIIASAILLVTCGGFPTPKANPSGSNPRSTEVDLNSQSAIVYLQRFGYLPGRSDENSQLSSVISQQAYGKAIRKFQKMMGLKPTGELDSETKKMMTLPRCGVKDDLKKSSIEPFAFGRYKMRVRATKKLRKSRERSRTKRYALQGGQWSKNILKYHIVNYTPDMTENEVRISIKKAFELWSNHTNLEFISTNNPSEADIKISFGEGFHGDHFPFDGPGGELAHAYYPSDGRAHFDDAEKFLFEGRGRGVDLFTVAAHEFGHNLGLQHSSVSDALMAPVYKGYIPNLKLHNDDIEGIQALYGKKINSPKTDENSNSGKTETTGKKIDLCKNQASIDSAHYDHREKVLFAFKGKHFWKIGKKGVLEGYPKLISTQWKKLPKNIDASVNSITTGRTYFFKGSKVWRYDEKKTLERGFPQPVSALGLPSRPDAAVQWRRDGMVYVFKNAEFYQFSEYQRYNGGNHYGKWKISKYWKGAPSRPEAVFRWSDGNTYFVKRDKVWGFPGLNTSVFDNFPKNFKSKWLKCKQGSLPQKLRMPRKYKKPRRNRRIHRRLRGRKHKVSH